MVAAPSLLTLGEVMNRKFAKYICEKCGEKKYAKKDACKCAEKKKAAPKKKAEKPADAE